MMKEQEQIVQKWVGQGWVRPEEIDILDENNKPLIFKHQKPVESLFKYAFSLRQICQVAQDSMSNETKNFSQYQGIFKQNMNHLMTFMQPISEGESSRYYTLWRMGVDDHSLLAFASSYPKEAASLSSKHLQVIRQYIEKGRSFSEIHRLFDAGVFFHVDEPVKKDFSGRRVLFERQIMVFPLYVDLVEAYQFVHKHQHDGRGFLPMTLEAVAWNGGSLGGGIGWIQYGKTLEELHGLTGKIPSPQWGPFPPTLTQTFMSFMADDLGDVYRSEYGERNVSNGDEYYYLNGMALCHALIARGVDANQLFELLKECAKRADGCVDSMKDIGDHLHSEAQKRADFQQSGKLSSFDLPIFPLQSKYSMPPFFRFILPILLDLGILWEEIFTLIDTSQDDEYFGMWDSHFSYSILRWVEAFGSLSALNQENSTVRKDLMGFWKERVQPCIDQGLSAEETIKAWKIQARMQKVKPGQINGFMQTVLNLLKQGVMLDDLFRWSEDKRGSLRLARHALGLMMTKDEKVSWAEHFETYDTSKSSVSSLLQAGWCIKEGAIHLEYRVISLNGQYPIRVDYHERYQLYEAYCQWIMGGLSHRHVWSLLLADSAPRNGGSSSRQGRDPNVQAHLSALFKDINGVIPSNPQLLSHLTIDQFEYLRSKVRENYQGTFDSTKAFRNDLLQVFSTLRERGVTFEQAKKIFRIGRQKVGAGMYGMLPLKIAENLVKKSDDFDDIYNFFKKIAHSSHAKEYMQWLDFFSRRGMGLACINAFYTYKKGFSKGDLWRRPFMPFREDTQRLISGLLARKVPLDEMMGIPHRLMDLFPKKDWVMHLLRLVEWGIPFKTLQQLVLSGFFSIMQGVTLDDLMTVCAKLGLSREDLKSVQEKDALRFYQALYICCELRFLETPFNQIKPLKDRKILAILHFPSTLAFIREEAPTNGVQSSEAAHAAGADHSSSSSAQKIVVPLKAIKEMSKQTKLWQLLERDGVPLHEMMAVLLKIEDKVGISDLKTLYPRMFANVELFGSAEKAKEWMSRRLGALRSRVSEEYFARLSNSRRDVKLRRLYPFFFDMCIPYLRACDLIVFSEFLKCVPQKKGLMVGVEPKNENEKGGAKPHNGF